MRNAFWLHSVQSTTVAGILLRDWNTVYPLLTAYICIALKYPYMREGGGGGYGVEKVIHNARALHNALCSQRFLTGVQGNQITGDLTEFQCPFSV